MTDRLWQHDRELVGRTGAESLCGIDEAGRGPLAGPVCAAAVILPERACIQGLNDSKKLSANRRESLALEIRTHARAWNLGWVEAEVIDRMGILQATFLAMRLAVEGLDTNPDYLLVDGRDYPFTGSPGDSLVKGDGKSASIAAASILAKVGRDMRMLEEAERWPAYGFESHKGYGTAAHMAQIQKHGRCPLHRKSFKLPWEKVQPGLGLDS